MRIASIRLRAPIRSNVRDRWLRTVLALTDNSAAISPVEAPAAAIRRTSCSRGVSGFSSMARAVRASRVDHAPAGGHPAYAPGQPLDRVSW